jgi:hypothetical protein
MTISVASAARSQNLKKRTAQTQAGFSKPATQLPVALGSLLAQRQQL